MTCSELSRNTEGSIEASDIAISLFYSELATIFESPMVTVGSCLLVLVLLFFSISNSIKGHLNQIKPIYVSHI